MKPMLLITEKIFSVIVDDNQYRKSYIITFADLLPSYDEDYSSLNGYFAHKNIACNQIYIGSLFQVVPYLYQYYEISERHFELLGYAAGNLESLYKAEIQKSSTNVEETNRLRIELSDYLDKVALIFQTAADKTESALMRPLYRSKAGEYSGKADIERGVVQDDSHMAKMQRLYQKVADERPCTGELFRLRAHECQVKREEEALQPGPRSASSSFSSTASASPPSSHFFAPSREEEQPLVGGHRRHGPSSSIASVDD